MKEETIDVAAFVLRSRNAQGLTPTVEDQVILSRIAALIASADQRSKKDAAHGEAAGSSRRPPLSLLVAFPTPMKGKLTDDHRT